MRGQNFLSLTRFFLTPGDQGRLHYGDYWPSVICCRLITMNYLINQKMSAHPVSNLALCTTTLGQTELTSYSQECTGWSPFLQHQAICQAVSHELITRADKKDTHTVTERKRSRFNWMQCVRGGDHRSDSELNHTSARRGFWCFRSASQNGRREKNQSACSLPVEWCVSPRTWGR